MARIDGVKITIQGSAIDTEINLAPIGVIASAEKWHQVSKSVELEVMGFAKLFLGKSEKGRAKGKKRRVGMTMEEMMDRERKSFTKALRKGEVTFIDPEDVTG